MLRQVAQWSIVAMTAAACSGPGGALKAPPPDVDEMVAWNGRLDGAISDEQLDPKVLAAWWTTLEDDLLTDLVQRASTANLDLRRAGARLRQARSQRRSAEAAGAPTVGTTGAAGRSGSGDASSDLFSLGLDAQWELDVFGGIERGVEAAEADEQTAIELRRDVLVSTLAEVALNYVDLRTLERRRDLASANLTTQEGVLERTETQLELGAGNQLDVDRARSNVETTRAALPRLDHQVQQTRNRLAVLLGQAPGTLDAELAREATLALPSMRIAVGVPAEVLRRRPDVRSAERRLAAETARVGVAIADLYPKFVLGGSIGLEASSLPNLFESASRLFSLGPRMQWTIFDGGRLDERVETQNAVQEEALVDYEQTILLALEEVEVAISALTQERIRNRSLVVARDSARNAAELARLRYDAGEVDFLSVLDAQRVRLAADDDLASSDGECLANVVRLYKALGGGWSVDEPAVVESGAE